MSGAESRLQEREGEEQPEIERLWQSREVQWSGASGLLLALGFVLGLLGAAAGTVTAIYIIATVVGARFFAHEALEELLRERRVAIELLMTTAALAAGGLGLWAEAATLAFLYSISEALEAFTERRTRRAIRALIDLAPKRVTLLLDGREEVIPADDLKVGDRFLVRPGESIATDGEVWEGGSAPAGAEQVPHGRMSF